MTEPIFSFTIRFGSVLFGSVRIPKLRYSVYSVFTHFGRTMLATNCRGSFNLWLFFNKVLGWYSISNYNLQVFSRLNGIFFASILLHFGTFWPDINIILSDRQVFRHSGTKVKLLLIDQWNCLENRYHPNSQPNTLAGICKLLKFQYTDVPKWKSCG